MADADPLPSPDEPLTVPLLEEAWSKGFPSTWSAQRFAVCVLYAHGRAMQPSDVVAYARARQSQASLTTDSARAVLSHDRLYTS